MTEKAKKLLVAMNAMSDLSTFQDKAKELLNLEVYELQPSLTAGILYDLLLEELLTPEGMDIANEFLFSVPTPYDDENPYVITETCENGEPLVHLITDNVSLCQYLDKNKLLK